MANYLSPTGSPITGTLERLSGRANISSIDENGQPEHSGGTDVFWDDMMTVTRDGKIVYLDEAGEEWTFDQLAPEVDEDEEAA
ncbi:hypothetical protein [Mesorhizobium sp. P5_C1]